MAFRWVLLMLSWVLGILATHLHSHILGPLFLAFRWVLLMLSWVLGILATHLHSHILGPLFLAFRWVLLRLSWVLGQWWANLDQASKDLDKTIFRDLSPTPIP
jgi:hypothetical protein